MIRKIYYEDFKLTYSSLITLAEGKSNRSGNREGNTRQSASRAGSANACMLSRQKVDPFWSELLFGIPAGGRNFQISDGLHPRLYLQKSSLLVNHARDTLETLLTRWTQMWACDNYVTWTCHFHAHNFFISTDRDSQGQRESRLVGWIQPLLCGSTE